MSTLPELYCETNADPATVEDTAMVNLTGPGATDPIASDSIFASSSTPAYDFSPPDFSWPSSATLSPVVKPASNWSSESSVEIGWSAGTPTFPSLYHDDPPAYGYPSNTSYISSPIPTDFCPLLPSSLQWERRGEKGQWKVLCPRCDAWIGTSSFSHIQPTSTTSLENHMKGSKCKAKTAAVVEQRSVLAGTKHARDTLFPMFRHASSTSTLPNDSKSARAVSAPPDSPTKQATSSIIEIVTPSRFRHLNYTTSSDSDSEEFELPSPTRRRTSSISFARSHARSVEDTSKTECPGISLDWPHSNFWSSYPWQRHGFSTIGYHFDAVEDAVSSSHVRFRVRSDICLHVSESGAACSACVAVKETVSHLAGMSQHADAHTNHRFLTHDQLRGLIRDKDTSLKTWKLKALNLGRKVGLLMQKLDDSRRFVMAVATGDIPRLQQLVRQGLKDHASISAIVGRIEQALDGVYRARGYSPIDLDMSLMVLRLGGRKLLYAMNQYIAIPSIRMLRRAHSSIRLMPSVGMPTRYEILHNMKAIFCPKDCDISANATPRQTRSGMTVLWDEVNEENAACYIEHMDSVGGLCREHSCNINLRLNTMDNALSIAHALADGSVHYGKEVSVIALASFGTAIRGAFPVCVSPTCKSESPPESACILQEVFGAWTELQDSFGPIWTFASDGDAGRRAMVYSMFLKHEIVAGHALYKYVGRLPGLNRWVGDGDVTGTFDWKHEIKRWARLLRTSEGMVVGRTVINHETLRRHMLRNGQSSHHVELLLNPADSQDVPRAIDLIDVMHSLATTPRTDCDPFDIHELQVISVIGDMVTSFVHAFIHPTWSLSEQVVSLSKYAHMSFALFRDNRVMFMPAQLYGDTQTTVKDIIITVAKQQDLDGSQPFYLFWTGDDRLEVLFGLVRMIGGHNPNFTFAQILDRLGAAMDLNGVFSRHPELDQGHRRLKVTRTEQADHLNPESWIGNVRADSVDLEAAWKSGRDAALTSLAQIRMAVDFSSLFTDQSDVDMLRPFGDGKYPGVSTDSDRSEELLDMTNGQAMQPCNAAQDADIYLVQQTDSPDTAGIDSDVPCSVRPPGDKVHFETVPFQLPLPGGEDDDESRCDLEDLLEDVAPLPSPLHSVDPWIERHSSEGGRIHKSTVCRVVITPDYVRKSHERILRVRDFTSDTRHRQYNSDNIIDGDTFMVNDLFTTLLRCDSKVSLAILKCIAIEEKNRSINHVKVQSLPHPASGVRLVSQILAMERVPSTGSFSSESPGGPATMPATSSQLSQADGPITHEYAWVWNGQFAKLSLAQAVSSPIGKAGRKTIAVKVPSFLCEPVNPDVADLQGLLSEADVANATVTSPKLTALTWKLNEVELDVVISKLWETVGRNNATKQIPHFRSNEEFPYKYGSNGQIGLLSVEGCAHFESEGAETSSNVFRCYQCLENVPVHRARSHVSGHILRKLRGVDEELCGIPIPEDSMPCGFCGRVGVNGCNEVFLSKGKNPQALTRCPHFRKFKYKSALESTDSMPSTNVPILCTIPGCTGTVGDQLTAIWKYNMAAHLRKQHPGYSIDPFDGGAPVPEDLAYSMFITAEEEERIGITAEKIPIKVLSQIPLSIATSSKTPKRMQPRRSLQA